jgi:flagellar biosynthetic protein FliP
MKHWLKFLAFSMAFAALPALAPAQGPAPAPAASTQPAPQLPAMGDLINAVDKATKSSDGKASDWSNPVKLALVFTGLALLPSLLVMVTSFTRIVIVLGFIRRALTTQTIPPTVALVGLALFLTLFTMSSTFGKINEQAIQPYLHDKMTFPDTCTRSSDLLKQFMVRQTRPSDLALFIEMSGTAKPTTVEQVPLTVAIPAFAISEFRTAFEMGCLLFIPFLLIDLVISGVLLSAGMMMLPPSLVSLPFKIILFVLVDGWRLVAEQLVKSFHY